MSTYKIVYTDGSTVTQVAERYELEGLWLHFYRYEKLVASYRTLNIERCYSIRPNSELS